MRQQHWTVWLLSHHPIFVAFAFFIASWALSGYGVALTGGWKTLSRRFRYTGTFNGEKRSFQSAKMRFPFGNYGNCLTIGADESGLYMSPFLLLRFGHPPLLIPWSEISVFHGEKGFLFKTRELHLGREEAVPLRIKVALAEVLRLAAGSKWPVESFG